MALKHLQWILFFGREKIIGKSVEKTLTKNFKTKFVTKRLDKTLQQKNLNNTLRQKNDTWIRLEGRRIFLPQSFYLKILGCKVFISIFCCNFFFSKNFLSRSVFQNFCIEVFKWSFLAIVHMPSRTSLGFIKKKSVL